MNKQKLISQIQMNLKEIYHRAIDADKVIQHQVTQGQAKFASIFKDEGLFKTKDKQFLPYIEELASDLILLEESADDEHFVAQLKILLKKLEQINRLLTQFKSIS